MLLFGLNNTEIAQWSVKGAAEIAQSLTNNIKLSEISQKSILDLLVALGLNQDNCLRLGLRYLQTSINLRIVQKWETKGFGLKVMPLGGCLSCVSSGAILKYPPTTMLSVWYTLFKSEIREETSLSKF